MSDPHDADPDKARSPEALAEGRATSDGSADAADGDGHESPGDDQPEAGGETALGNAEPPRELATESSAPPDLSSQQGPPPGDTAEDALAPTLDEAQAWTSTARAAVLFGLLGMALPSWFRLSRGGELAFDLLRKNAMPMAERDVFLAQILGTGFGIAFVTLCVCLFVTKPADLPKRLEGWAWFLSPLILLPAIPIVGCFAAWHQKHQELLPIVLFLALLTEFFVSRSLMNVPESVVRDSTGLGWRIGPRLDGPFLKRHAWLIAVIAAALFYGIFMSYFTLRWHNRLGTATFDLGINDNLIYGGLHGKINQSTVIFPDDPQKYIANHVKLGLYLFLPIYALHPGAETLLVIQSVSLGLGAIPLFLFARRRLPEWAALVLALAYLAYYPMHGANFYEMKLVPTAAAFVLTMIWAVDSKRWITTGIFFFLTLIMREDLPVPLAVVGGFLLLSGYRPRAGAIICGVSITWFVLLRFKVMTDAGAWWFPNMYEDLWSEPETGFRSVLKTLVSNPTFVLHHIFTEKKFWYLMHLLVPIAFLPVRRWYLWACLVPGAILTLLVTNYDPPVMFSFQYVMNWSPYLFVCAALAVAAISEQTGGKARASAAIAAVAVASSALSFNYGAFPLRDRYLEAGYHKIRFDWGPEEQTQYEEVQRLKRLIPRDASVATTERIGPHFSSRVLFYTLRRGTQGATYIVAQRSGLRLGRTKQVVTDALKSGEYGLIDRYGEIILLQKGADASRNEEILKEWRLTRRSRSRKDDEVEERFEEDKGEEDKGEDHDPVHESGEDDDSQSAAERRPSRTVRPPRGGLIPPRPPLPQPAPAESEPAPPAPQGARP